MSERLRQAIAKIIAFIAALKASDDRVRPEPYLTGQFRKDVCEEEKRNRGFADDFCKFYEGMDEWKPRGWNIYGTGANKYDMNKGTKHLGYRVLVYFDKKNNNMVFLSIYPKADEPQVLGKDGKRLLKKYVEEVKAGQVPLTSFAESPA